MRATTTRAAIALALATTALALAALPAAADGAWMIEGRGYSHGVGLSQYGALGFAERGRSYRRILGHYYTKTRLGRVRARTVRVLLGSRSGRWPSVALAGRAAGGSPSAADYSFGAAGAG